MSRYRYRPVTVLSPTLPFSGQRYRFRANVTDRSNFTVT